MSRYAFDRERMVIVVSWPTMDGDEARDLAAVEGPPPPAESARLNRLLRTLTDLSESVWSTYVHRAIAAQGSDAHPEGRRRKEREAFAHVLEILAEPNPDGEGRSAEAATATEKAARRVGEALRALNDAALTERVTADVAAELAAVEEAERGEHRPPLSSRADQSAHRRSGVSQRQLEAADRILHEDPVYPLNSLSTDVDPAVAAIAAAHWLHAAAEAVTELCGVAFRDVVAKDEQLAGVQTSSPAVLVLEVMEDLGIGPLEAVTGLLRASALSAEHYEDRDIPRMIYREELHAVVRLSRGDVDLSQELLNTVITFFMSVSPGNLLENLLRALEGCWFVFLVHDPLGDDDEEERDPALPPPDVRFTECVRRIAFDHRERLR